MREMEPETEKLNYNIYIFGLGSSNEFSGTSFMFALFAAMFSLDPRPVYSGAFTTGQDVVPEKILKLDVKNQSEYDVRVLTSDVADVILNQLPEDEDPAIGAAIAFQADFNAPYALCISSNLSDFVSRDTIISR